MGEIWLLLGAMVLCVAGCATAGYWAARRVGYSVTLVSCGVVAAGMLIFGRYLADGVWIAQIVPAWMLPIFGNWLPPMAGFLAGAGWVISRRQPWAKAVPLGVLILCAMYLPYRWIFEDHPEVHNRWAGPLCLQTTDATCGAAAAATLLRSAGIRTTEHEMVDLCFTTWRGTPLHGVIRGLAKKTEGTPWRVKVMNANAAELARLGRPAILRVGLDGTASPDTRYVRDWGWQPGVAHMVVVYQVRPDGMLNIADPSTGWESWDPEALDVLWQGIAITLEKREPGNASMVMSRPKGARNRVLSRTMPTAGYPTD